ncbi:MAG: hypothetical protein ABI591_20065 [Kofleriaceae bacterium]
MRIATSTRVTCGIVLGALVGAGIWLADRSPSPPELPSFAPPPAALDDELEPSSSSVQQEPPSPPSPPFYASLFVAGATWTLPCTFGFERKTSDTERCHVDSVEVTNGETRARIACWFVHDPEVRDDPAINTYVMTARGLYLNSTSGEPMFTPHPIAKPLPKRWGLDEPTGLEPMRASAIVRHDGAWCSVYEMAGTDTSFGYTECISSRGFAGFGDHRDFTRHRCGDVP